MPGTRPSPRSSTSALPGPCGGRVVEEDDPLGERHGAGRPGDQRLVAGERRATSNRRSRLSSTATWPPAIASAAQSRQDRARSRPGGWRRPRRCSTAAQRSLELRVDLVACARGGRASSWRTASMRRVALLLERARLARVRCPRSRRGVERVLEPQVVEAAASCRSGLLALPVGGGELGVVARRPRRRARAAAGSRRAPARCVCSSVVLVLALLPARRDRRPTRPAMPCRGRARRRRVGLAALRPEQDDRAGSTTGVDELRRTAGTGRRRSRARQLARTLTRSPTVSSMRRSSS